MGLNLFLGIFITAIVLLIVLAIYAIAKGAPIQTWLPIAISVFALLVSLLSAFKSDLLPSDIIVIGGDALLAQTDPLSEQPVIPFAFSLGFINQGYGDEIVEWVAIRATNQNDKTAKLLTPLVQIDFQKFIQGSRHLHAENIIGPFAAFSLGSKSSLTKTIVFDQEPNHAKYPKSNWSPGKYRFDLFLKVASSSSSKLVLSIHHTLTEQILNSFFGGTSCHLTNRSFDL